MIELSALLVSMVDALQPANGELVISTIDLELPIEARLAGGALQASWPRGRLETGFDPPLGMLVVQLSSEEGA